METTALPLCHLSTKDGTVTAQPRLAWYDDIAYHGPECESTGRPALGVPQEVPR